MLEMACIGFEAKQSRKLKANRAKENPLGMLINIYMIIKK
jgi:hypothetical protein